jgi:CubicO group peptidase (beta-lactamase class C family)
MKTRHLILTVFLFMCLASGYAQAQTTEYPKADELNKYLDDARSEWNIPGMAVAVIADDEVVYQHGFGVANIETGEQVNTETIFGIASNTKAFTSAALAILVDRGSINWDDPVQNYLPWFKLYAPYVSANITIRDLLSHRSGLKTFSGDLIWYASAHSRREILERAQYLEPQYGFREKFGYSNIMYLAAGQIIEAVTDTTWEDFVSHHLLSPIQMDRTSTSITQLPQFENVAQPHNLLDDKNITIPWVNWDNIAPAGGINSSVSDVAKWIRLQLNRGQWEDQTIFSKEQSNKMWQQVTPLPVSSYSLQRYPFIQWRAYGLGWSIHDFHGYKVVTHSGGLDGMISRVVMVPEKKLGFVILTNNINGATSWLSYELLDRYLNTGSNDWSAQGLKLQKRYEEREEKHKEEIEASRIPNTSPSLPMEAYTGTYHCQLYGNVIVSIEEDKLHLQFEETKIFESSLNHWHFDTFTLKFGQVPSLPGGWVKFSLSKEGEVSGLSVDVPNPDFDFTEFNFVKI